MNVMSQAYPLYRQIRLCAYSRRCALSVPARLVLAFGAASLTGLLAQVRMPHPWLPSVPITGQVLGVLLAGVLLGGGWGAASQGIYVVLGLAGVPWFAGWGGGIAHLAGPTGGFIVGFVLAAGLVGHVCDRYVGARGFWPQVGLMTVAVLLIYVLGAVHMAAMLHWGFGTILGKVVIAFLPIDSAKALLAAGLASALLPRTAFGPERKSPRDRQARAGRS